MTKQYILDFLKTHHVYLEERFAVEKIGLFGSYAKDKATLQSDIDFYVTLKQKKLDNMAGLWNYLEESLGKKVDILFDHPKLRKGLKMVIEKEVLYA
ncbi:MAG TPA: hypothetical protein ENK77_03755 [Epsilonproteobacteria bacterium]|nr:hypothetical protein [Campylobacterota bacterium]